MKHKSTKSMGVPDRWLKYSASSLVIPGTRFLAFKVPLRETICQNLVPSLRFTPHQLLQAQPKLGMVVDLTYTTRYYDREEEFVRKGVQHEKIFCPGQVIPPDNLFNQFVAAVDDFIKRSAKDRLIGVHCTHGLNRTGYFICRYMAEKLNMNPDEAIKVFEEARGHEMERENYKRAIKDYWEQNRARNSCLNPIFPPSQRPDESVMRPLIFSPSPSDSQLFKNFRFEFPGFKRESVEVAPGTSRWDVPSPVQCNTPPEPVPRERLLHPPSRNEAPVSPTTPPTEPDVKPSPPRARPSLRRDNPRKGKYSDSSYRKERPNTRSYSTYSRSSTYRDDRRYKTDNRRNIDEGRPRRSRDNSNKSRRETPYEKFLESLRLDSERSDRPSWSERRPRSDKQSNNWLSRSNDWIEPVVLDEPPMQPVKPETPETPVVKPVRYFAAKDDDLAAVSFEEDLAAQKIRLPEKERTYPNPFSEKQVKLNYQRLFPAISVRKAPTVTENWCIETRNEVKDVVTLE